MAKIKRKPSSRLSKKSKPKKVSAIPKGYNNITPYLMIDGAISAIEFYKKIFNAKEKIRLEYPPGKIVHAELQIGDTKLMLADEQVEMNALSPQKIGGTPVSIHLYIKHVDYVVEHAILAGAKLIRSPQDMFFGDRSAVIEDPYGHKWTIATHIEDVSLAKVKRRATELFNNQG